jgi:hypothetical protein
MKNLINENLVNDYLQNIDKVKDFLGMYEKFSSYLKNFNDNNKDNTLLHVAVSNKDILTVTLILDILNYFDSNTKSKFINAQNKNGDTALHIAANLCQNTINHTDANKTCEAIAKLLDANGASKNIANHGGEIIGVSDIESVNSSPLSEYKSKILNMAGGFLNLSLNSSTSDNKWKSKNLYNQLNNVSSDVSLENKNPKRSLENMYTEVSVDNKPKQNLSSSVSAFSENTKSSSSSTQSIKAPGA